MGNGKSGENGTDALKRHTQDPSAAQEKLEHRVVRGLVCSQTLVGNHVMVALLTSGIAMTLQTQRKRLVKVSLTQINCVFFIKITDKVVSHKTVLTRCSVCQEPGRLTEWTEWSLCSGSPACGPGLERQRVRRCVADIPEYE